MWIKYLIIIIGLAFLMTGCSGFKRYEKISTEEYTIDAKDKYSLKIDNINGGINIKSSEDSLIRIKISKHINVKKKDLDKPFTEIKINLDTNGSEIKIDSDIFAKSGGLFSQVKNPFVDYEISLPSFIDLNLENTNGFVTIKNMSGNVIVDIINGSIEISGSPKKLNLGVTNGDITGKLDSINSVNIDCINSEIMLTLPKDIQGKYSIETLNGKIETDNINISLSETDKKSLNGRNGEGTIPINVKNVNGKIFLIGK